MIKIIKNVKYPLRKFSEGAEIICSPAYAFASSGAPQPAKIATESADDALPKRKGHTVTAAPRQGRSVCRPEEVTKRRKVTHQPCTGSNSSGKKREMPHRVRAYHILVKHEGSRRRASWRDPEGEVISRTSKESAVERLTGLREEIVSKGRRFEDVARVWSDCSSAKRGGDLGYFGRGKMQKHFEEAAFALKVGEISDIVDTDSGVHIILRAD